MLAYAYKFKCFAFTIFLRESKSFRDEPSDQIKNFESLKSKIRITGKILAASNVNYVKISVSLKYLSNF